MVVGGKRSLWSRRRVPVEPSQVPSGSRAEVKLQLRRSAAQSLRDHVRQSSNTSSPPDSHTLSPPEVLPFARAIL